MHSESMSLELESSFCLPAAGVEELAEEQLFELETSSVVQASTWSIRRWHFAAWFTFSLIAVLLQRLREDLV